MSPILRSVRLTMRCRGTPKALIRSLPALPPSPLEQRERLEQLRALEAGMRIDVAIVDRAPPEVNTAEDLELVRAVMRRSDRQTR